MKAHLPGQRALAALVIASLALLAILGSVSRPPDVAISDLPLIDGGSVISVRGIVVDAWSSDAGSLSVVLADLGDLSTVKVVCVQGPLSAGLQVHIGDEVRVTGELDVAGTRPIIWTTFDDVLLLLPSRDVMTISDLARSWELFLDDRFDIAGILVLDAQSGELRLADPAGESSIAVEMPQGDCARFSEKRVVVDAELRLRPEKMVLVLEVLSLSLAL